MNRIALLTSSAAAVAALALAAGPGAAQTPPASLHLVSAERHAVVPKHPRFGSTAEFVSAVSGDDHGTGSTVCTVVGGRALMCSMELQLAKGTLTAQGMLPEHARNTPVAITGGTGAYDGARGTALATDQSGRTSIDVHLLG